MGMNDDVWHRLDCIRKDPGREYLSQRMKHANALRINKGRTGPKGEEGIKDDLYKALGRNPNPEEVQREMRRNKGYGGVSQKRRQAREIQVSSTSDDGKDGVKEGSEEDVWGVQDGLSLKRKKGKAVEEGIVYEASYVRGIEEELQKLRARTTREGTPSIPSAVE